MEYSMYDFKYDASAVYVTWVVLVSLVFKFSKGRCEWGMGKFNTHRYVDIPRPIAWSLMESGSFIHPVLALITALGGVAAISSSDFNFVEALKAHPGALPLLLFSVHYGSRVLIDPIQQMQAQKVPTLPLHIAVASLVFTSCNGLMQARDSLAMDTPLPLWQTAVGATLWFIGFCGNRYSDATLRRLKDEAQTYVIPRDPVFDFVNVAAPNYFFELIEMTGYTIAANFHLGAVLFLFSEIANLTCRAHDYHVYYEDTFGKRYTALNRAVMVPRVW